MAVYLSKMAATMIGPNCNEYVAVMMDNILFYKLSVYGISENAESLLKSYLSDRKQQIKITNVISRWAKINKGVPQGSMLGPLPFNVFIKICL